MICSKIIEILYSVTKQYIHDLIRYDLDCLELSLYMDLSLSKLYIFKIVNDIWLLNFFISSF